MTDQARKLADELLPCPFCGTEDIELWTGFGTQADICCKSCSCERAVQVVDMREDGEPYPEFDNKTFRYPEWLIERTNNYLISEWNTRAALRSQPVMPSREAKRLSVNEYAADYEYRGDQDYVPTEGERAMIEDAIEGYLSLSSPSHEAPAPVAWLLSWSTLTTDNKLVFLSEEAATEQQQELEDNDKVQYTSLDPLSLASPPNSGERLTSREMVAEIPFDPTNHHNALKCPYCNPKGLSLASPPVQCREALEEIASIIARYERTLTLPDVKAIKKIWNIASAALALLSQPAKSGETERPVASDRGSEQ